MPEPGDTDIWPPAGVTVLASKAKVEGFWVWEGAGKERGCHFVRDGSVCLLLGILLQPDSRST